MSHEHMGIGVESIANNISTKHERFSLFLGWLPAPLLKFNYIDKKRVHWNNILESCTTSKAFFPTFSKIFFLFLTPLSIIADGIW